jgi:3-hydroxybutyryl-CoA dehydrogenase
LTHCNSACRIVEELLLPGGEGKMVLQKIMVLGAGQMGSGIAQVCATGGFSVLLGDIDQECLNRAVAGIDGNLRRSVEKGRLKETEREAIIGRIKAAPGLDAAAEVEMVVEAVVENEAVKKKVFAALDKICPPFTILASNTSSVPITRIAAATGRPQKVIGMHFMNPVPIMKLVEIIRGVATDDQTFNIVKEVAEKLGKVPVEVNDFPGFVSNRILMPMINEAVFCLMEGVSTAEGIDTVMKLGMNHPMGPLELADLIGLDTCLAIMEVLYEGFRDSRYRPCPLLRKYVDASWLGRKTGRGFYLYS